MKTISLESTLAINTFSFKSALVLFGQWIGASPRLALSLAGKTIQIVLDGSDHSWV